MFYDFPGYIPNDMYLTEAEATPELQVQLLAYDPAKFERFHIMRNSKYLDYIQRLVRFLEIHFSNILIII